MLVSVCDLRTGLVPSLQRGMEGRGVRVHPEKAETENPLESLQMTFAIHSDVK